MKKLESSLKNMVLSLSLISIFIAGLLALIYGMTKEPIAMAEKQKQENAIKNVTPDFNNNPTEEKFEVEIAEGDVLTVFPAKKDGKLVGFAVESNTTKGFSGLIEVMVGFDVDGNLVDYTVLKHAETPGLGTKMQEWFRPQTEKEKSLIETIFGFEVKSKERNSSVINKNLAKDKLVVTNDGGDIDGITAATISSRAFIDAINRAYEAFVKVKPTEDDFQSEELITDSQVEETTEEELITE
jgi:electron transport complex, RnfABCDGE type, G subunit